MSNAVKIILLAIITILFIQQNFYGVTMHKKTIMIDLDGVLNNYTVYTKEIPSIRESAKDFVKSLSKDYELVLFTTRPQKLAQKWLVDNETDKYFKEVTNIKKPAYIYLDDRAVKFEGDYSKTLKEINDFKVYWNKQ